MTAQSQRPGLFLATFAALFPIGCVVEVLDAAPGADVAASEQALYPGVTLWVDFEDSSLEEDEEDLLIWNRGKKYRIQREGDGPTFDTIGAWFSSTMAYAGDHGFGVRLDPVPLGGTLADSYKQRVEFQISGEDEDDKDSPLGFQQYLEESRFYGFAMYIHPQTDNIQRPTIFFQGWQSHDTSGKNAKYPPLGLVLTATQGDEFAWAVETSKDPLPGADPQGNKAIYDMSTPLQRGRWHRFVVRFKPSVSQAGAVQVWLDGGLEFAQTSERDFGYRLRDSPKVNPQFEVRFGAYRGRWANEETILVFDEARQGHSRAAVDPFGATCAHSPFSLGQVLSSDCDPCVEQVVAADWYCGLAEWDFICAVSAINDCGVSLF